MFSIISTDYISKEDLEQLWVLVRINKTKIAICVAYKSPHAPISCISEFEEVLTNVISMADDIIVTGDLNVDFLKNDSRHLKYLSNILQCFSLKQIIDEPTRIGDTSSTLIDIICTNRPEKVINHGTMDLLNMTDHLLIYCSLDYTVAKVRSQKITFRDYRFFNEHEFFKDASAIQWMFIENLPDIEDKLDFINKAILTLYDIHAPYRTVNKRKPSKPYITDTIKEIIRLKHSTYNKYRKTKSNIHLQLYKDI